MEFLSAAWIDAADAAVKKLASTAPQGSLTIDQHIPGRVSYRVVIDRVEAGVFAVDADGPPLGAPDAAFTQTEATARSLAAGDTDAHQAFLLGQISFDGDIDMVIARREALTWLQAALAPVMASTELGK
jgi:hypothetical protein